MYEDEWLLDPLVMRMIEDVDKSVVVGPRLIDSPVLGAISPRELSGGVKALILMAKDKTGKVFNASACGDNCAKWILEISAAGDLTINLRHLMNFGGDGFEIFVINTQQYVTTMSELVYIAAQYV